ncbi:MAG: DUF6134 family protein [Pseudomonadota bacterium]
MKRRDFLLATGAACAAPSLSLATERAFRKFRILRDGDDIGTHELSATLEGGIFQVDIRVEIAVKFLGFTAYRYNLINRERWQDGTILSVDSRVDDDGADEFCRIERAGDELSVTGSRFTGMLPATAVTTSYYTPAFLERRPWISTQSGDALEVQIASAGPGRWQASGELETQLIYDDRGEWVGSIFDAGGETATYEVVTDTGLIAALWAAA